MEFYSSLLQLRGSSQPTLPLTSQEGNVLLYNGEVFGGIPVEDGENDGEVLLRRLAAAGPAVMEAVRGPWAIVLWHPQSDTLWFGRDVMGKHLKLFTLSPAMHL